MFDVAVVEMEKKRFDVKSYLQPTNAKERQHRLLCKLEAKQKESTGVTDSDLLRQIHRHQEIVETVLDAQQEGCSFALGIDSKELHKSKLRSCLRTFTDAQSVTMLQCRAKEADTRTLFEMRDFMCLHGDHISRDMFYCKLNGGRSHRPMPCLITSPESLVYTVLCHASSPQCLVHTVLCHASSPVLNAWSTPSCAIPHHLNAWSMPCLITSPRPQPPRALWMATSMPHGMQNRCIMNPQLVLALVPNRITCCRLHHDDHHAFHLTVLAWFRSLLDIETMQKYQAFEASPGAAVVPRTTVEGMYALKKTLNQIGAVDADIKDAETKITQDAMPVPVPITSVVP